MFWYLNKFRDLPFSRNFGKSRGLLVQSVKKDEMAGAYVTPRRKGNAVGNSEHAGKGDLKKGVDGRLMLDLKETGLEGFKGYVWLWMGTGIGLLLISDSIKCGIFLD